MYTQFRVNIKVSRLFFQSQLNQQESRFGCHEELQGRHHDKGRLEVNGAISLMGLIFLQYFLVTIIKLTPSDDSKYIFIL